MEFWIFMLIMVLLIPLIMIIFGAIYKKRPPKNINLFSGYRTARSTSSQEAWDFAHRTFGALWFIFGLSIILPFGLSMLFVLNKSVDEISTFGTILVFLEFIPMIFPIFIVEKKLKKNFDENGNKINPKD